MSQPRRQGDEALEELLAAYADQRLAPDEARLSQLRARLVADFARARSAPPAGRRPARRLRWAFPIAFAVLLLTSGVAVAGSGPGRPFYDLRLAIERALVPPFGLPHSQALLDHLDDRLEEIVASARSGDRAGLEAALAAYRGELEGLSGDPQTADVEEMVLMRLARHARVLSEVLGNVPDDASRGLQEALDRAERARQAIEGAGDGEDDDEDPDEAPGTGPPVVVPVPTIEPPVPDGLPSGPP